MEQYTKGHPKHPQSLHLLGMISYEGPSRLVLFSETLTADLFRRYLGLLTKDAQNLYSDRNYRIYMDNDPKHRSSKVQQWTKDNHVDVPKDWPSNSPDLNPIENVWGLMAREIQKLYPRNKEDLKKYIRAIWRKVATKGLCERLVESMPNRLQEVIAREGSKINY
jgi:hypothetical protein